MRYRIGKYNLGGWGIQHLETVKKGPNKGKQRWLYIAFPGDMRQTVERMIDLSLESPESDFTAEKVSTLLDALENGVSRILDTLEAMPDVESGVTFEL